MEYEEADDANDDDYAPSYSEESDEDTMGTHDGMNEKLSKQIFYQSNLVLTFSTPHPCILTYIDMERESKGQRQVNELL